jgi:aldehyde:ferredoxin oxidoreductase
MKGFFNRILKIDLAKNNFWYEEIPDAILEKTLGGKGLGAYLLLNENPPEVHPLSPENVFIIATGPVTGTKMWSQSRFGVFSKSPATGGYGESYCGGRLAPKIKGCGVDAVLIKGKCSKLTFLCIDENGVTFHNASFLQGVDTYSSEEQILLNSKSDSVAMVIGPAGENLVRFACIKSDRWRSLGRGGMGAIFGAKNLKGISFCGTKKAEIADGELLKKVIKDVAKKGKESSITAVYRKFGTPMQVEVTNKHKCFPSSYWKSGYFPKWENISADYMQRNFEVEMKGCPNCFLRCTKSSKIKKGRHKGLVIEGPEYETIFAIGGLNEIDSLEEVAFLNDVCDRLGIDTISAGNISAFAIEAVNRGRIEFKIGYNQPDEVAELYHLIARNEGIGQIFAKGIKSAASELGLEDYAIHVKGLEPAGFDPRVLKGMGLSYATSARGACHLRGTFYKAELSGEIKKDRVIGKARLHIDYEDRAALFDSLILCRFFRDFIIWRELGDLVEATTGLKMKKTELEILANRFTQMTRNYNIREGMDHRTDTLPRRFLEEPTLEGATLSREELSTMLGEYNKIRKERDDKEKIKM